MPLNQKHALITGGSRGIGRGIALKLAEDGVKVGVHYYRNESAANDTLQEVRKRGSDGFVPASGGEPRELVIPCLCGGAIVKLCSSGKWIPALRSECFAMI